MEEEDAADFEALCELLGLTAVAFLKQASDGFEPIKQGFSVPEAKPCDVFIRGTQGAKLPVWVKEVSMHHLLALDAGLWIANDLQPGHCEVL